MLRAFTPLTVQVVWRSPPGSQVWAAAGRARRRKGKTQSNLPVRADLPLVWTSNISSHRPARPGLPGTRETPQDRHLPKRVMIFKGWHPV